MICPQKTWLPALVVLTISLLLSSLGQMKFVRAFYAKTLQKKM